MSVKFAEFNPNLSKDEIKEICQKIKEMLESDVGSTTMELIWGPDIQVKQDNKLEEL